MAWLLNKTRSQYKLKSACIYIIYKVCHIRNTVHCIKNGQYIWFEKLDTIIMQVFMYCVSDVT